MPKIEVIERFCIGSKWRFYDDLKKKQVGFAFEVTPDEKKGLIDFGPSRSGPLLSHLKKKYGGLDNFELVFFRGEYPEPYYIVEESEKTIVYVNIDIYKSYGATINPVINNLKITQYAKKIQSFFSKRIPEAFFKKENPSILSDELKSSYIKIVEDFINEFENMGDLERQSLKDALEHTKPFNEVIEKYVKLNPDSPEIQLKLFLKVVDKLGEREVEELLNILLASGVSKFVIKAIAKLPINEQNKVITNVPEMAKMYSRYIDLNKSLKKFEKKIKRHLESGRRDERDIHKFLAKHYWLLGVEYFDKEMCSDITPLGERTGETNIGRKHSDFMIKRVNGLDKCIVIEIEEANDRVFNDDGTLSKAVYDGIIQAVDYMIEQRSRGIYSKGMAVIGYVFDTLTDDQKKRLRILSETFHNVEVLTYNDIIDKARSSLAFFKQETGNE